MTKRKTITAEELARQLNADPDSVARRAEREDRRVLREAEIQVVSEGLRRRLAEAGYPVDAIHDIVKRYAPLPPALANVLLDVLPSARDPALQGQIVRALAAVAEPFDGQALALLFAETSSESLRWSIANTVAEARPTGVATWVLSALRNPAYGKGREMLAVAAARLARASEANAILVDLLTEMPGHAALGLAESGGQRELEALEARRADTKGWIRKDIDRAIRMIRSRSSNA